MSQMFGIGLRQTQSTQLRQEQKLIITPQLQQAIKLLQLNHVELAEMLQEELLENPILEDLVQELEEEQTEPAPASDEDTPLFSSQEEAEAEPQTEANLAEGAAAAEAADAQLQEAAAALTAETPEESSVSPEDVFNETDWSAYFEDIDFSTSALPSIRETPDNDLPTMESRLTPHEDLSQQLMWQLHMTKLHQDALNMAVLIIGHLNDDGWLLLEDDPKTDPLDSLAQQMVEEELKLQEEEGDQEHINETPEESFAYWREIAEEALQSVQELDPAGVAARNLQECLLLQCRQLSETEDIPLIKRLIRDHLKSLERKSYTKIAKQIKVSLEEIVDAEKVISRLEPYPGRNYDTDPPSYITPDIHIKKVGDEYKVTLNDDGLPKLKISAYYKQALKGDSEEKEFIQEKLRSATWLLRSIHQRQRTIYKVTESIVRRQKDFLDKGIQYLKPMILRNVAQDIEMHESTISRVTTNKYVHTPQGVFELKFFFTSSLQSSKGGEDISSLTVKEKIRRMIENEDSKNPLSDQNIVKILGQEGIKIARRTVAKYRGMLNIPSSNRRKQLF